MGFYGYPLSPVLDVLRVMAIRKSTLDFMELSRLHLYSKPMILEYQRAGRVIPVIILLPSRVTSVWVHTLF
jgi:hypothetical protein